MILKLSPYIAERIQRKKNQFRVDTFRAGGKGGQNQNKVESGVRITDLVTGISAEGRDERDQPQNRSNAFHRLCQKLIDYYRAEELAARAPKPEAARAIRSYKLDDGIVIDHRTNKRYAAKQVLDGKLDPIIEELMVSKAEVF